ncbi:acylneuraminate cytidylyltransferase family protein [Acetobacterium woodii]|uniref:N-acylneuraminate cytidylyltransferase NeuA n=1 Tax=Acetobacterium woodii (strain ATCC 29683 / DSM 1030 / JCM 2381 / KCTC 1655 / WB1) TaxID=931626 RepID=H6LDS5_ACEWD|nr:acylneuraminate cytidylyltransferase family protein [Acetobacterium woodii]AFA49239.1 N-acylneuraminate cytidylyltransferase NeuA [Acetobacterium woodii DSM 1030]
MRNLAIIPARSGSKGLKDKNIKLLNGKPLLAYTIEVALESDIFDEIFVSTDSDVYAKIAQDYGANVPFLRSKELSTDTASSWNVVRDAVLSFRKIGGEFDTIALLQPTSPLRENKDIINAYHLMKMKNANTIVSVCEVDHSPLWSNILPEDKSLDNFLKEEFLNTNRQNLPTFYRVNGAIYIVKVDYLMKVENIYKENSYAYVMDKKRSVDIDDEFDFNYAKEILVEKFPKLRRIGEKRPNAFYNGKKEQLKTIIMGCDPSTEDNSLKFDTVFNLREDNGDVNFMNPYFNNIYKNLQYIFTENSGNKEFFQDEKFANQIYVQNLCKDYLEHETGYYKDNWAKWINYNTVYIEEFIQELNLVDPLHKLPVFLTAEELINALVLKERVHHYSCKILDYYQNRCGLIRSEDNKLGRILIPLGKLPSFNLAEFPQYCSIIKSTLKE